MSEHNSNNKKLFYVYIYYVLIKKLTVFQTLIYLDFRLLYIKGVEVGSV